MMSFSISLHWEKPIEAASKAEKFAAWSRDVQDLLAYLIAPEHPIPSFFAFDSCYRVEVKEDGSRFLVQIDPPPREENWLVGCGAEGKGEPIFTPTYVVFNGDASRGKDYEDFALSLEALDQAPNWCHCKTAMNPYTNLVICAVVRFVHYFPEATIYQDEDEKPVAKAAAFCKHIFGDNQSPRPSD
jgi:hypothetical protein